jgi:hypothetical protein
MNYRKNLIKMVIIFTFLIACRTVTTGPTAQPEKTPTAAVSPTAPAPLSEVLVACAPETQAAAMRPDQVPDWEALQLAACYNLSLELQPAHGSYIGQAKVTFTNLTGVPLSEIIFRTYPNATRIYGGELAVTDAKVDKQPVTPEVLLDDRTALRIPLAAPLASGATTVVDLSFSGQAPTDFGGLPDVYGIFNYDTDTEVLALANWYPLLAVWQSGAWQLEPVIGVGDAVVSETALYQVDVTAPDGWEVVASGAAVGKTKQGTDIRRAFVSGPMREFIVMASPSFVETTAEHNGIQVRHWGLPDGEARWPEALQATVDSLNIYEERFGPYPYAELDVVAAPMKNAAGVEYPGVFLILDTLYRPNQDRPFFLGLVVAHEAAHQWWYGVVGSDVLANPWQDEGLTTFSSLVYQEAYQPEYYMGTLQFYEQAVDEIAALTADIDITQPVSGFLNRENAYGVVVYDRSALFFEDLRQRLGDEKFYGALQAYYNTNRYKLADPAALLSAFETACACDLDAVYASWGAD